MSNLIQYYRVFLPKFKRRCLKYFSQILKDPHWFLMFFTSRIKFFRDWGIYFSKTKEYFFIKKIEIKYQKTIFEEIDPEKIVRSLREDGLYCGINLPQKIIQEILTFSSQINYWGNADPRFPFFLENQDREEKKFQCRFITGHHFNPSQNCPAIKTIENDSMLWKIAAEYLETKPVLVESRIRWTFAIGETVDEPFRGVFKFHYDLEDYRFIKFMFYLTDVDELSCPHSCVKGSHNHKKLSHQFSLLRERDDQEIIDYYGRDKVQTIYGQAGFGFVEDFYCFHKATLPVYRDRLILEVKFAMNKYRV